MQLMFAYYFQKMRNSGFFLICFLLIFTPLARAGSHFWAQTIVQTTALSGLFILFASRIARQRPLFEKNPLDAPLSAIGLVVLIAAFRSDYPSLAAEGAIMFFTYTAVYYLAVNFITTRKEQRITVCVIAGTAGFISVIALLKRFDINPFFFWEYKDLSPNNFLTGTYGNHNHFAGCLEMAIPMLLCLLFTRNRTVVMKITIIGIAIFLLMMLTFTFSRGGWIATFSALVFMAGVSLKEKMHGKTFFIRTLLSLLAVLILILISTPVFQRMAPLIQANRSDHVEFRLKVWERSVALIKDHPVTGTGPGTFGQAFPLYNPGGFKVLPVTAHNDYIQFVAEIGVLFVPLGLWLLYCFFCTGFTKLKGRSRQTSGLTLGAMTSVFALLIHTAFDFNLHIPANALLFTVLCALVCVVPPDRGSETGSISAASGVRK